MKNKLIQLFLTILILLPTAACTAKDNSLSEAKAHFNIGLQQLTQGKLDEAVTTYNEIIKKYEESTDPTIQAEVAKSLVNKGVALGKQNKFDMEIASYNEVIKRFGASRIPTLQIEVASAIFNKG